MARKISELAAVIVAVLASASLTTQLAHAQDRGGAEIVIGGARPGRTEARDLDVYQAARTAFQRGSYAALAPHLTRLKTALEHAPATYAIVEQTGPGRWIVRADDMNQTVTRSAIASAMAEQTEPGRRATIATGPNVYPAIALMLGSEAIERHAFDEAVAYLDRGLALQPGHFQLAAEKMGALQGQGRWADALLVGDATLEADGLDALIGESSGILHRRRGYSLIELGRLDEAKSAYERSLEVDPESTVARGELDYIEKLKAGAPPTVGTPNYTVPSA